MALKFLSAAKALKDEDSLRVLLHEHLSGFDPHRGTKNVHASELTKPEGFCPRFYAITDKNPKLLRDTWLTTSERVTFRIGRDMQNSIVNWFGDMDRAVGHWRCTSCNRLATLSRRPVKCGHCDCRSFEPEEVRFVSKLSGASCGIDMLVKLSGQKLVPVEIKTMDKEKFKELKGPLAEHRLRSNLYLRIIDESGTTDIDTSRIIVLYTTKGGYGCADPSLAKSHITDKFSPFKEYTITRDDKLTDSLVKRAMVVKDFRDGKVGMPIGICDTIAIPRAKYCSACVECFSGKHPVEYDWT